MVLTPDALVPDRSQPSIIALGGFVIGIMTLGIVVWDRVVGRGRALQAIDGRIERLCEQMDELEGRLKVVDGLVESVRELTHEWRGVSGDNGWRSIVKDNHQRIKAIEKRNDRIDAVREEDERRSGGKRRRLMDRELEDLDDS